MEREIWDFIEAELHRRPLKALKRVHDEQSLAYREGQALFVDTEEQALSYLTARFPATYQVARAVVSELGAHFEEGFSTVLEVGAGPGTASFAAKERWPQARVDALEPSDEMRRLGQRLSKALALDINYQEGVAESSPLPQSELILASYVLNELKAELREKVLERLWEHSKKALVIIEPGTPENYQRLMKDRDFLIAKGASVLAPCPHNKPCPLLKGKVKEESWCHFSKRVMRSKAHKFLKGGDMGYEDEKYCYLIVGKAPSKLNYSRLIKDPRLFGGHASFDLCTEEGIKEEKLSKKHKEVYRRARKLKWGDRF